VANAHGYHNPDPQPPTLSEPIAQGLVGPLQIEVDGGTIYIAQSFAGVLTKVTKNGSTDIVSNPGGEVSGIAVKGKSIFYTAGNGELPANTVNRLRKGESSVVVDTLEYEKANNPDAEQSYGIADLDADCAAAWPVEEAGPPSYTGAENIDSHAYALANGDKEIYIADAGANAILALGRDGELRTVAVLPPQPTVITKEAADANGIPECAIGHTYNFEAVPTDVEIGHDGKLYVTTLPGGPEDPSLGARGSVYRISPFSGRVKQIATGFLGATNLALAKGDIYVTELFGGRVSKVVDGGPETLIELPAPAGLEYANGKLYVSYDVFPPEDGPPNGIVATISLGRTY
jgi:hypothetical protein